MFRVVGLFFPVYCTDAVQCVRARRSPKAAVKSAHFPAKTGVTPQQRVTHFPATAGVNYPATTGHSLPRNNGCFPATAGDEKMPRAAGIALIMVPVTTGSEGQ